jgi:hypothetical protein
MAKRTRDEAYAPASPRDEAGAEPGGDGVWSTGLDTRMGTGAAAESAFGQGGELEQLPRRASVKRYKRRVVTYVQSLMTRFFTGGRPALAVAS